MIKYDINNSYNSTTTNKYQRHFDLQKRLLKITEFSITVTDIN